VRRVQTIAAPRTTAAHLVRLDASHRLGGLGDRARAGDRERGVREHQQRAQRRPRVGRVVAALGDQPREHGDRIALELPLDHVVPPDVVVALAPPQHGRERLRDEAPARLGGVALRERSIAAPADLGQRQLGELAVNAAGHREVGQRRRGVDRREVRVRGQIDRPPRRLIGARRLHPQLRGAFEVVPIPDQPHPQAVLRDLARRHRRRVQLLGLDGVRDEVVVVLDGALAVLARDETDHVQVPLGDRLERSDRLADLEQDPVALERALRPTRGLEIVGDDLQHLAGGPERAQTTSAIADPQQRLAEIEVRERGLVGPPAEPIVAQHPLPLQPRRGRRAGRLELDRRQRRMPRLGEHARRLAPASQPRRAERPLERALLHGEVPLRLGVAAEREQHVPRLPVPPERQVRGRRAVEPGLVVAALDLVVLEELAVQRQRLARASFAERLLRPLARLDLLRRRHRYPLAASSTISSARRRFSATRPSESALTT
jgi:hypothetical protein